MSNTILSVVTAAKAQEAGSARGAEVMRNLRLALTSAPSTLASETRLLAGVLEARRAEEEGAMQALIMSATPFLSVDWDAIERDCRATNDAMIAPGANGDNLHTLALPYSEPAPEATAPPTEPVETAPEAAQAPAEPVKRSRRKVAS